MDQRPILRNHSRDIVDSGAGGDVYPVGAARRCVMVDWMVRRGIQLNSNRHFAILTRTFAFLAILRTPLFINYAIRNHGCATRGSGGVTVVESAVSSGTTGGFVASGEDEIRGGAVSPAIRLFIEAANASLCGSGVEVWETATPCGLAGTPLPVFPASTQGRQKPVTR